MKALPNQQDEWITQNEKQQAIMKRACCCVLT
jgi:hypothetical protein